MASRWVQFVKEWSAKNNESYMCAATKPEVREAYRAKYGVSKRKPQYKEEQDMAAEDVRSTKVREEGQNIRGLGLELPRVLELSPTAPTAPVKQKRIRKPAQTAENTSRFSVGDTVVFDVVSYHPYKVPLQITKITDEYIFYDGVNKGKVKKEKWGGIWKRGDKRPGYTVEQWNREFDDLVAQEEENKKKKGIVKWKK